jgi:hypothetical protein
LGKPDRVDHAEDGEAVLIWELGKSRGYTVRYSVLVRGDSVAASWFGSERDG